MTPKNIFQPAFNKWLLTKPIPKDGFIKSVFGQNVSIGSALGLVRKENQDRAICAKFNSRNSKNRTYILFALADGMGGMTDGAQCATLLLSTLLSNLIETNLPQPFMMLCSAAASANKAIYNKYSGRGGATLSAILFDNIGSNSAINIGDSRIYQVDDKDYFKQISVDDTIDGQLAAMKKEPAGIHGSNQLVQYVGMGEGMEPQEVKLSARGKLKTLLITSDGAHYVGDSMIENLLKNSPSAFLFNYRLLNLSQWLGGNDNATSICIDCSTLKDIFQSQDLSDDLIQILTPQGNYDFPNYLNSETIDSASDKQTAPNVTKKQQQNSGIHVGSVTEDVVNAKNELSPKNSTENEGNITMEGADLRVKEPVAAPHKKNVRKGRAKKTAKNGENTAPSDDNASNNNVVQIELFHNPEGKDRK